MNKWLEEALWIAMPTLAGIVTIFVGYFMLNFSAIFVFNVTVVVGFSTWIAIMVNEFNKYFKGLKEIRQMSLDK